MVISVQAALRILLKGAKYVKKYVSSTFRGKIFTKPGGYERAEKDFYAVRPYNVVIAPGSIAGKVDGRSIVLLRNVGDEPPTIIFHDANFNRVQTIEYTPVRH